MRLIVGPNHVHNLAMNFTHSTSITKKSKRKYLDLQDLPYAVRGIGVSYARLEFNLQLASILVYTEATRRPDGH